jgi:hypothetical protein
LIKKIAKQSRNAKPIDFSLIKVWGRMEMAERAAWILSSSRPSGKT